MGDKDKRDKDKLGLPQPSCDQCMYFLQELDERYGECRRYAPRTVLTIDQTETWWPVVKDEDWCGEYLRRKNNDSN